MAKTIGVVWVMVGLLAFSCHSGRRKAGDSTAGATSAGATSAGGRSTDSTWTAMRGNISFVFPARGYAYDHRQELIQECLDGEQHDLGILKVKAFADTFAVRFVDSREEMKKYTGIPAGGVTAMPPYRMVWLEINEQEPGAPIPHELMHEITQTSWGYPHPTSIWMNEGLAAYSQNSCNGYTDEQIFRYLDVSRRLLPMDSMVNTFYHTPEMIGYHQAGCIMEYLLKHYGVEKVRELWQGGFDRFAAIFGASWAKVEVEIKAEVGRDCPKAPGIDWKSFEVGCR